MKKAWSFILVENMWIAESGLTWNRKLKSNQFAIFSPWKVPWNWLALCGVFLKFDDLMRRETGSLTLNPFASSKNSLAENVDWNIKVSYNVMVST